MLRIGVYVCLETWLDLVLPQNETAHASQLFVYIAPLWLLELAMAWKGAPMILLTEKVTTVTAHLS